MRFSLSLPLLFIFSGISLAQTSEVQTRVGLVLFARDLEVEGGGFKISAKSNEGATLRGTLSAVRIFKYASEKKSIEAVPHLEKHKAFVIACFDPKIGAFADVPGGKPDLMITCIGVMVAMELKIPKEKFAQAMSYIETNAKSFEEVRLAAGAVEAWGVKECPFKLTEWIKMARAVLVDAPSGSHDPRMIGSVVALLLRIGEKLPDRDLVVERLNKGQLADGGWGKAGAKQSDLETTYRVMRAWHLLGERPKEVARVRLFLDRCANADSGFGVAPGEPSSASGSYYRAIIGHWLDLYQEKK